MNPLKVLLIFPVLFILACANGQLGNSYTGIIEGTVVKIPALSGGQITDMFVDLGHIVDSGQAVAQIDSTELSYQRQQLSAGLRELDVQSNIAQTNLQLSKKDQSYIQTRYQRIEKLYQANSVSQQDYDDIKNQLQKINSVVLTAQQQLQSLAARKETLRAQIQLLAKKIDDTIVKSPVSGVISAKYFEQGEAVPPMQPVVEVTKLNKVETKIYISEQLLAEIAYDQSVLVEIDGLDKTVSGRISWISPQAEFTPKNILTPETRTTLVYAVKVTIDNPDLILKHGMPVLIYLREI